MLERVAIALPLLVLGCQGSADDTSANASASATGSSTESGAASNGSAPSEASVVPPAASSPTEPPAGSLTAVPPQSSSSAGVEPSVTITIPPVSVNPTTPMSPVGGGGSSAEPVETGGGSAVAGASSGGVAGTETAGGAATSLGGGGGSGVAGSPAVESAGCGTAPTAELETWVESSVTAADLERQIWVRLPGNYDPARIYPLVVLLHGCGDENNNVPMQNAAGDDAILIRSVAQTDCWDNGSDSPDIPLFEEMIRYSAANFCVDEQRVFVVGYSSGSWLVNRLSCERPELFRAAGTVAGGDPGGGNCSSAGNIAHIFIHDLDDGDNDISGSENARDRLLEANGCDANTAPVAEDPEPCARYQSCDPAYPIVWCATSGEGHGRQDNLAASAFWNFFTSLPSP
jgi:polyhydroxybutyrate depolymerase